MNQSYDVIIIGAGAAGLMCAIEAGKRGRKVWLIDHAKKTAEKIRISGGGRCNFTNIHTKPQAYLSGNAHFCKSALKQYTQDDFIALVRKYGIAYHEKDLGQLFCDESAQQVIDMLLAECEAAGVVYQNEVSVDSVSLKGERYLVHSSEGVFDTESLVIATGGLSIPKIGATKFGYEVARQFGLNVTPLRAGLVPLTFQSDLLDMCRELSGISVDAEVSCNGVRFDEGLLFTHRGLSGPSILQISSYWHDGNEIEVNLARGVDVLSVLKEKKKSAAKSEVQTVLAEILPKRLAVAVCENVGIAGRIADLPDKRLEALARAVNAWRIKPSGTEGYRTAEVTLGGVDTDDLSSKTMEAKAQKGLYFIGEVVDVTGHLGGFNFQWAWSSGFVAGQYV
jgi:predicted Rossmann fold flavoprotein